MRNVLGGELETCSIDPLTGWFRDGSCRTDPSDRGSHTICAVVLTDRDKEILDLLDSALHAPQTRFGNVEFYRPTIRRWQDC